MRVGRSTPPTGQVASTFAVNGEGDRLALEGVLDIHTLPEAQRSLRQALKQRKKGALDLANLSGLDTPGALFLCGLGDKGVAFTGVRAEHKALLDLVCGLELKPLPKPKSVPRWRQFIIGLMAVMISIVIGYQGVAQLRPYGGEDFTINLVAVSMLREMGVLITAIMVAGRSGSAFAAEIGVMKARDEIDALNVMGMNPMALLVVPRVIGLVITLPLLTFFSDVMGLVGGAVISQVQLGVSPVQYVDRVHHALDASDLFVGLFKAPVFGFLIAVIGCMHGLRVRGSADSVGRETTRAVVKTIFVVIVLDALFSILFEKLGL